MHLVGPQAKSDYRAPSCKRIHLLSASDLCPRLRTTLPNTPFAHCHSRRIAFTLIPLRHPSCIARSTFSSNLLPPLIQRPTFTRAAHAPWYRSRTIKKAGKAHRIRLPYSVVASQQAAPALQTLSAPYPCSQQELQPHSPLPPNVRHFPSALFITPG